MDLEYSPKSHVFKDLVSSLVVGGRLNTEKGRGKCLRYRKQVLEGEDAPLVFPYLFI